MMPILSIEAGTTTVSDVEVTVVGDGLFRLDEEPALLLAADDEAQIGSFPRFGDTLLATRVNETTLCFVSVHSRGLYRHYDFLLSRAAAESAKLNALLETVAAEGGNWSWHMGGLLLVSMPNASSLDIEAEVALAVKPSFGQGR